MTTHVLAGDIGGTNARFALFELGKTPRFVHGASLESKAYPSLEKALDEFLEDARAEGFLDRKTKIAAASFGIAGPVVDQTVKTTNLPWKIDAKKLGKHAKIAKLTLLNDLVSIGMGALAAPKNKLSIVRGGRPKTKAANVAVIAAGTGLGEAFFVWDGTEHIACASEGSHVDLAPRNEIEDRLLVELRKELKGRVSYERIASGSQITRVYRFFTKTVGVKETKAVTAELEKAEDTNVAITELAVSGKSEAAMRTIDLWCSVYGAEAGNLVLKTLATGGLFVCGGVSARLADVLAKGLPHRKAKVSPFVEAFLDKGRMHHIVDATPIAVCIEPKAGLLGAASHAAGQV